MRKRRFRKLRNGLIWLMFIVAVVLFILASFQLSLVNPQGIIAMVVSGGYILAFWSVNCDE